MCLISERYGFIYVRVPRTASTSCVYDLKQRYDDVLMTGTQHATARELRDLWGPVWGTSFTFGYVRNPWDWLVSMYNSGVSSGAGVKEAWPGARIEPHDAPGIHPGQRTEMAFPEWVRQRKTTPIDWLADENGGLLVKAVRRYEDFIEHASVKLSDVPHAPYREWYDDDTARFVAARCAAEIELGGYEF